MMKQYAFIAHSSHDKLFVEQLATELRAEGVWFDIWDMDLGDALPSKIEGGIEGASEFIIILSREALKSPWVQYESHMAVIRSLEDRNFRIVTVRIDDCDVPLRFKPFLYIDSPEDPSSAIPHLKEFLQKRRTGEAVEEILYRRRFINRANEIGLIEEHVADPEIRIVRLHGLFGIGKFTLLRETIHRLWHGPQITIISLSPSHQVGSRLCLELCAYAGLELPADGASAEELNKASLLAVETLVSRRQIIVFNHLESILDEEGVPTTNFITILNHLLSIPACSKVPVFLISTRLPNLTPSQRARVGTVKVSGMQIKHLSIILEGEVNRIERKEYTNREELVSVAEQLYGYPLGAKLAAPMLVKFSPEFLLENLAYIKDLRIDIADAILSNLRIDEESTKILELLALFDGSLSVKQLSDISNKPSDEILNYVDILTDQNILESDDIAVRLHPLIGDFYFKQVRSGPNFKDFAKQLANFAEASLKASTIGTPDYIHWLTHTSRLLFLCGELEEGRKLRFDLLGELKMAAIELYQQRENKLSLRYCEEYLRSDPDDFQILFHKARCLSRLERSDEAMKIIEDLLSKPFSPRTKARLHYAQGRTYHEKRDFKKAKDYYLQAIKLSPDYVSALTSLGDALFHTGKVKDAEGFLKRALKISPMDPFVLSLYSNVLWNMGEHEEAIKMMEPAVKAQPKNATFLFRYGRFHKDLGDLDEAHKLFRKAKESDDTYFDARLSLASVAIDLNFHEEAKIEIDELRPRLTGEKRRILQNIEAQYELAIGNFDEALKLATASSKVARTVATLGLLAEIEIKFCIEAGLKGMNVLADSHRERAREYIDEGLKKEPTNPALLDQKGRIDN